MEIVSMNTKAMFKKALHPISGPYRSYLTNKQTRIFQEWHRNYKKSEESLTQHRNESHKFAHKPLISLIVPTYNTPRKFFIELLDSVKSQTYDNWELIFVDDASPDISTREMIQEAAKSESRIKSVFLETNHHIADATNKGVEVAHGEYVGLLDHDDLLDPDALFQVVKCINNHPDVNYIYTDEAKIDEKKIPYQPFLKPDWNAEFLRSINYITHFSVIRASVYRSSGGENSKYNGTQDWELCLRITRSLTPAEIQHIPEILYYWRVHRNSTAHEINAKPYIIDAQKKALESDIVARGIDIETIQDPNNPVYWQTIYPYSTMREVVVLVESSNIKVSIDYPRYKVKLLSDIQSNKLIKENNKAVIIVARRNLFVTKKDIQILIGEVARSDIGVVVPFEPNKKIVFSNTRSILQNEVVNFIQSLSSRSFTHHVYCRTRYSLPYILEANIYGIAAEKLSTLTDINFLDVKKLSQSVSQPGVNSVYNPYIKMVK